MSHSLLSTHAIQFGYKLKDPYPSILSTKALLSQSIGWTETQNGLICYTRQPPLNLTCSCKEDKSTPSMDEMPNREDSKAGLASLPTHKNSSMPFSSRNTASGTNLRRYQGMC